MEDRVWAGCVVPWTKDLHDELVAVGVVVVVTTAFFFSMPPAMGERWSLPLLWLREGLVSELEVWTNATAGLLL